MTFQQIVSSMREQMHATLARTDALRPLIWPIALLSAATVGAAYRGGPEWLLILLAALLVGSILLYGFAFLFLLFKDRDALRSEKYALQKMAIEHGLIGDDGTGLFEEDKDSSDKAAPVRSTKQIGRTKS